jgi:hypothetical protein
VAPFGTLGPALPYNTPEEIEAADAFCAEAGGVIRTATGYKCGSQGEQECQGIGGTVLDRACDPTLNYFSSDCPPPVVGCFGIITNEAPFDDGMGGNPAEEIAQAYRDACDAGICDFISEQVGIDVSDCRVYIGPRACGDVLLYSIALDCCEP